MPKKRIFQVAKELNISHVDIMEFLKENSIDVSSHMAPMDDDTYEMVLSEFNKERLEVNRLRKEQARQAIITNENETIIQQEQEQDPSLRTSHQKIQYQHQMVEPPKVILG